MNLKRKTEYLIEVGNILDFFYLWLVELPNKHHPLCNVQLTTSLLMTQLF